MGGVLLDPHSQPNNKPPQCDNVDKIYKKVSSGVRPATLNKVKDLEVKAFIEKCLAQPRAGPSAAELLRDPFFDEIIDDDDENDDCTETRVGEERMDISRYHMINKLRQN
ncbi:putative serine/threonine-protein kinase WNK11 [Glycine soja]|uniref:non-specific serine/threonine protein kinase n=1 Tax=Glycine soja TaxID=3848 RepID=A0A445L8S4_GLYSO|nr:putative serine/threonine-protein kinase WNK11 [Glycine soja]